jgi:hypothetical protein
LRAPCPTTSPRHPRSHKPVTAIHERTSRCLRRGQGSLPLPASSRNLLQGRLWLCRLGGELSAQLRPGVHLEGRQRETVRPEALPALALFAQGRAGAPGAARRAGAMVEGAVAGQGGRGQPPQGFSVKKLLVDREWMETGDEGFRLMAPARLLAEWEENHVLAAASSGSFTPSGPSRTLSVGWSRSARKTS